MTLGEFSARLMGMNDEVWRRHANPWSGWSRLATFPLLFLAAWSHVWIGWRWVFPVAVVCLWIWLNPRIFPKAKSTKSWMSRAVLGERVWLNRKVRPIPAGHQRAANILSALSLAGVAVSALGFWRGDFWAAFMGWNFAVLCKMWFVDRMVWLYEDMKDQDETYASWLY